MTSSNQGELTQIKPYIFLDTCIIQDAGSSTKSKSDAVIKLFTDLRHNFNLAISEFTIYENLQGLWGKRAIEAGKILGSYEAKEVSRKVLLLSSILQSLYHEEKYDNIADGDKIIGATAILESGYVLTRNHKDFPHPFFVTEQSFVVNYKNGHYAQSIDFTLYKPNYELISRRIESKDR